MTDCTCGTIRHCKVHGLGTTKLLGTGRVSVTELPGYGEYVEYVGDCGRRFVRWGVPGYINPEVYIARALLLTGVQATDVRLAGLGR